MSNVQNYRNEVTNSYKARIAKETRNVETMTDKEKGICERKLAKLARYFKVIDNEACMFLMLASGVSANIFNEDGRSNIYTIEKTCDLAAYLAERDFALDNYDLITFRTVVNCHKAGILATRNHVQDGICHDKTLSEAQSKLSFRVAGFHKDMSTAKAQDTSSLANLSNFGIVTKASDSEGNKGFRLNVDAFATKQLAKLLRIEL